MERIHASAAACQLNYILDINIIRLCIFYATSQPLWQLILRRPPHGSDAPDAQMLLLVQRQLLTMMMMRLLAIHPSIHPFLLPGRCAGARLRITTVYSADRRRLGSGAGAMPVPAAADG